MLPVMLLLLLADTQAPRPRQPAPVQRDTFFTSTMAPEDIRGKQAVLDTSEGVVVLDLLAAADRKSVV